MHLLLYANSSESDKAIVKITIPVVCGLKLRNRLMG